MSDIGLTLDKIVEVAGDITIKTVQLEDIADNLDELSSGYVVTNHRSELSIVYIRTKYVVSHQSVDFVDRYGKRIGDGTIKLAQYTLRPIMYLNITNTQYYHVLEGVSNE